MYCRGSFELVPGALGKCLHRNVVFNEGIDCFQEGIVILDVFGVDEGEIAFTGIVGSVSSVHQLCPHYLRLSNYTSDGR